MVRLELAHGIGEPLIERVGIAYGGRGEFLRRETLAQRTDSCIDATRLQRRPGGDFLPTAGGGVTAIAREHASQRVVHRAVADLYVDLRREVGRRDDAFERSVRTTGRHVAGIVPRRVECVRVHLAEAVVVRVPQQRFGQLEIRVDARVAGEARQRRQCGQFVDEVVGGRKALRVGRADDFDEGACALIVPGEREAALLIEALQNVGCGEADRRLTAACRLFEAKRDLVGARFGGRRLRRGD